MKYETGRLAVTKTGPNDMPRIVRALGEFLFIFPSFFLILTKLYMLHVIYEVRDREDVGDEYGPNHARRVVASFFLIFSSYLLMLTTLLYI